YAVSSDLLILLAPDQPYEIPGKAYEYLATGVDILALTQDGATADLMWKTGGGTVVEPENIGGIRKAVLERYGRWAANGSDDRREPGNAHMFERREVTRKLSPNLECLPLLFAGKDCCRLLACLPIRQIASGEFCM